MKRLFDTLAAAMGLIILWPVLVLVVWQVRRKMGSPVLFRQVRPGMHGRTFTMYKFRTMTNERNVEGNLFARCPTPDSSR